MTSRPHYKALIMDIIKHQDRAKAFLRNLIGLGIVLRKQPKARRNLRGKFRNKISNPKTGEAHGNRHLRSNTSVTY